MWCRSVILTNSELSHWFVVLSNQHVCTNNNMRKQKECFQKLTSWGQQLRSGSLGHLPWPLKACTFVEELCLITPWHCLRCVVNVTLNFDMEGCRYVYWKTIALEVEGGEYCEAKIQDKDGILPDNEDWYLLENNWRTEGPFMINVQKDRILQTKGRKSVNNTGEYYISHTLSCFARIS